MLTSAHAQDLYVGGNSPSGTVGLYDTRGSTVTEINTNFITGLSSPAGLAQNGITLLVSDFNTGTVGAYNSIDGFAINPTLISGLGTPYGLAVSINDLFVANFGGGSGTTVSEYNATTGAAINANFITGLSWGRFARL